MNTFLKFLAPAVSLAATFVLSTSANAVFLIDDFTSNSYALALNESTNNAGIFQNGPGIYMRSRTNFLRRAPGTPAGGAASTEVSGGFRGSNQIGFAYSEILYGSVGIATTPTGHFVDRGTNQSLAGTDFIDITVNSATAGTVMGVILQNYVVPGQPGVSGSVQYVKTISETISTPTTVRLDLNQGMGVLATRNEFDYFQLAIGMPEGGSFEISRVEAVPEPGTMIALGAGLVALSTKKKRKA